MKEQSTITTVTEDKTILNQIKLSGKVVEEPKYSHTSYGEDFYIMKVACERNSGTCDTLSVIVSNRLVDVDIIAENDYVYITGSIRTYNKKESDRFRLSVEVFATNIEVDDWGDLKDTDEAVLVGYICKQPNYRETPLGRVICDMLVAVNRHNKKSDYIPCIAWGRNAKYVSGLEVGTKVKLVGRLQSRVYTKKISEELKEERTTIELSINTIEKVQ